MRALVLVVMGCTAPAIELAEPTTSTDRAPITVESWDVELRYHEATAKQRADNIAKALSEDGVSDVLCLTGIQVDELRNTVLAGAKTRYPHQVFLRTDRTTAIDDPRGLDNKPVTLPTGPACTEPGDIAKLDATIACLAKCVGVDGFLDRKCAESTCTLPPPEQPRCNLCVAAQLNSGPLTALRAECVDKPRGELTHDGRLGAAIVSRFELEDPRVHVFPSSADRAGAVAATVRRGSARLDVVCADIASRFDTGPVTPFGGPLQGADAGAAEKILDQYRLIDVVAARARIRPTFVLGGIFEQWETRLTGVKELDYLSLAANFQPLVTIDSKLCTYCPKENAAIAIVGTTATNIPALFTAYFHLSGANPESIEASITRKEARYTLAGKPAPATILFGARATVTGLW